MRKLWVALLSVLILVGAGILLWPTPSVPELKHSEKIWAESDAAYAEVEEIEQAEIVESFVKNADSGYYKTSDDSVFYENDEAYLKITPHTCGSFHCEHEGILKNKITEGQTMNAGFVMPDGARNFRFYLMEEGGYKDMTEAFASIGKDGGKVFYTTNYQLSSKEANSFKFVYDVPPQKTDQGFVSAGKWELFLWKGDYDSPDWSLSLDPWFNTTFSARKEITVTENNATILKNYSIPLNVSFATGMTSRFIDLRFTWVNPATSVEEAIPHWTERNISSSFADVWIKIPTIRSSENETVYMYYANTTAVSDISNGTQTFLWYDDFEDNSVADWSTTNSPTVFAINDTTPYQGIHSMTCAGDGAGADSQCWYNFTNLTGNTQKMVLHYATNEGLFAGSNTLLHSVNKTSNEVAIIGNIQYDFAWSGNGTEIEILQPKSSNTWYKVEMMVDLTNNNASAKVNNTFGANATYRTTTNVDRLGIVELRNRNSDQGKGEWDLFYLRNFTTLEPSATFGPATNFTTAPGLELRVLDERNPSIQLRFNVTISNSSTTYTANDQLVFFDTSDNLPLGSVSIIPVNFSGGYAFREFNTILSDSLHVNMTAYLLKESDGIDYTFVVTDFSNNPIANALIVGNRTISGSQTTVFQGFTDTSGVFGTFLDPTATYSVRVSASGFTSVTFSLRPNIASPITYVRLAGGNQTTIVNETTAFQNITYSILPEDPYHTTNFTINYTITSSTNELETFNWTITRRNVTNHTTTYSVLSNTSAGGGSLTVAVPNGTNFTGWYDVNASFKKIGQPTVFLPLKSYFMGNQTGFFGVNPTVTGFSSVFFSIIAIMVTILAAGLFSRISIGLGLLGGVIVLAIFTFGLNMIAWPVFALTIVAVVAILIIRGNF